ncbi:MAG: hypothetical protein Q9226_006170 [Calogaya cf. arnoldii]
MILGSPSSLRKFRLTWVSKRGKENMWEKVERDRKVYFLTLFDIFLGQRAITSTEMAMESIDPRHTGSWNMEIALLEEKFGDVSLRKRLACESIVIQKDEGSATHSRVGKATTAWDKLWAEDWPGQSRGLAKRDG